MLVVTGVPRAGRRGRARRRVEGRRSRRRRGAPPPRPHRRHAPRLADGGRPAGHRLTGRRCPTRSKPAQVGHEQLAAPQGGVGAVAETVEGERQHRRRCGRAPPCTTATWAWWCCTATGGQVEVGGELGRQVLGMEVVGDDLGLDAVEVAEVVDGLQERAVGRRGARGRRCDGSAPPSWPVVTAMVLFSSAPTASTGPLGGERQRHRLGRVAPRAAQDLQAARSPARTTESSQRMWMARSWVSSAVDQRAETARRRRRRRGRSARRCGCRSSSRAAGRRRRASRWCSGAVGQEQPELGPARERPRRPTGAVGAAGHQHDRPARRRQGRRGGVVERRTAPRAAATSATITANGLSSRALRRRSSATAAVVGGVDGEVVAADALHRDDARRPRRAATAAARASAPVGTSAAVGVAATSAAARTTGQALGWAWKRRSPGSSYSAWQAGAHR